jgi:hypothetical protein
MRAVLLLASVAILGGCASGANLGPSDYEILLKKCQDRGGRLTPVPGANNANVNANYQCSVSGR